MLFWRKLIYWHSELEVEPECDPAARSEAAFTAAPWLRPHGDWDLHMIDCVLPDLADCQGRTIAELDLRAHFGCSVVGIERQGYMIVNPPPGRLCTRATGCCCSAWDRRWRRPRNS